MFGNICGTPLNLDLVAVAATISVPVTVFDFRFLDFSCFFLLSKVLLDLNLFACGSWRFSAPCRLFFVLVWFRLVLVWFWFGFGVWGDGVIRCMVCMGCMGLVSTEISAVVLPT